MAEKDSLLRAICAELAKVRKRMAKRQAELEEASHAEDYRNLGELILANRSQIERGASEFTVVNWFQGGKESVIPLESHLGPVENAQRYFRRWKKGAKARKVLPVLLRRDEKEEEWLVSLEERVASAETPEQIAELAERLVARGYRSQRLVKQVGAVAKEGRWPKGVRVYEDIGGFRVSIGKGAEGNERLLRELSSPDDIWLHTRGARGAHAIIKTDRHPERVPPQTLEKVAALVAHFSEERGAGTVAVDYTLRKYVRKVKAGRPGLVRYEKGKTLLVKPADHRLASSALAGSVSLPDHPEGAGE